jgi:hypothetical protein
MTNSERNPNDEFRNGAEVVARAFVIGDLSFVRHSTFVLRHSYR